MHTCAGCGKPCDGDLCDDCMDKLAEELADANQK